MPFIRRFLTTTLVAGTAGVGGWNWYTKDSIFVPYSAPDFNAALFAKRNPTNNPPALIDHCVRTVSFSQLKTTDQETLTKEFCRGVWSGPGFAIQRKYLERKYRALEGRSDQLWNVRDMTWSDYQVGTKIADHFEVIERTPEKVVVRCGDSPLNKDVRPSDGIFSIEVTKDERLRVAQFRLKSFFFNSTPEGSVAGTLPWWIPIAHREYTKLWMETSVRELLK